MYRKYLQIVSFLCLGLALFLYPWLSTFLHLDPTQILGFVVGFIGFAFWYFDNRLSSVQSKIEEDLRDHISETTLADAMKAAAESRQHWGLVRILATSTGQIQPLFESTRITADRVIVIMRKIEDHEIAEQPELKKFRLSIDQAVELWRDLERKGKIGSLYIYLHSSFPLEYNVIFDEKLLISGLLSPEFGRFSEVNVINPTVTRDRTRSGVREIKKYCDRFDALCRYIEEREKA